MPKFNQHNLSRTIPEEIKRQVRKNSYFGCVKCGKIPYEYEHVIPEYSDALSHEANKITLLCPNCHCLSTKGILSKEKIFDYMKNPFNKNLENLKGYNFEMDSLSTAPFTIKLGGITAINCKNFITIDGESILSFLPGEGNEPFIITALFKDIDGNNIFHIEKNEWLSSLKVWDIEVIGRTIIIRKKKGKIILKLTKENPNTIVINKIEMIHKGVRIFYKDKDFCKFQVGNLNFSLEAANYINSSHVLNIKDGIINFHSDGTVLFKRILFNS